MWLFLFAWFLAALATLPEACFVAGEARAADLSKEVMSAPLDLFAARQAGQIEVKVIAQDSTEGAVVIANKTRQPVTIQLPPAFAAVPVLAQAGAAGAGRNGRSGAGSGGGGGNQALGGGFAGGGGVGLGGGGLGGGGGVFNVEPDRVIKLKVPLICLEHGKRDPHPRIPYELTPAEVVIDDPKVIEVVQMLARGEINQTAAQAAAWHLANGLSWQFLAEKIGVKHLGGATERYFSSDDLARAIQIVNEAGRRSNGTKTISKSLGDSAPRQR